MTLLVDPRKNYEATTSGAVRHAAARLGRDVELAAVPTTAVDDAAGLVSAADAVIIGPGSPYFDPASVNLVIKEARERGVPLVGT